MLRYLLTYLLTYLQTGLTNYNAIDKNQNWIRYGYSVQLNNYLFIIQVLYKLKIIEKQSIRM